MSAPGCLCRNCLSRSGPSASPEPKPQPGPEPEAEAEADGYPDPDTGYWVFSRAYHLRRGHCCNNGCRHCPWRDPVSGSAAALVTALLMAWLWVGGLGSIGPVEASVVSETFDSDPASRGWTSVGSPGLAHWDASSGNLRIQWDSSRSNSFFVLPLGTTLSASDAFALEFDLRMESVGPRSADRPSVIQIAVGLVRHALLPEGLPSRLSGSARDLVEWDWFPASDIPGFGESPDAISPAVFGSQGTRAFSFDNFYNPGDGATWRIRFSADPVRRVIETRLWREGREMGPVNPVVLSTAFGDFAVDTLAVIGWSEQTTRFDSLEAVGRLDNIRLELPDPPIAGLQMTAPGVFSFQGAAGWRFTLSASGDLVHWSDVASVDKPGLGGGTQIADPRDGIYVSQFYRIRADR